ncbi:MAG: hypothetical protein VYA30_02635 [Myxococcota bacterium]|nr:hypothetical protein [Myxococcota bacterium]
MGILIPKLSRQVVVKTKLDEATVVERIDSNTEWLSQPPALVRRRLPYKAIWLLELDAPTTTRPLYGFRSTESIYLYRAPDHVKSAFQPNAAVSFKTFNGECELHLNLIPFKQAVTVARLTSGTGLCLAMVGLALIPKMGMMAIGFTAIALAIIFLNRIFASLFFNGEVDNLEECIKTVVSRIPPKG